MKSVTISPRALLLAACSVAILAPAGASAQTGGAPASYSIGAQDLGTALTTLARKAGREIYFSSDLTRGKKAPAVRNARTWEEALERLLAGSGLTYRINGNGAITILGAAGNADGGRADQASADSTGVAEILVVGSQSQNVDIRRSEDDAQPYVVFDRKEIERSQVSSLEEFFRKQLPMNSALFSLSQASERNASQIDLRGIGINQTLILVDGRRVPRVLASGVQLTQADINGIPLSAIERIEILPSTAGGIYGGGAVGGVVNIVRKRDYRGVDFRVSTDLTQRGGGDQVRLDMSGGFSPDEGKTQITFSGSYSNMSPFMLDDNDIWRRARSRFVANNAADLGGGLFSGSTPNIRSQTGAILTLKPQYGGGSLGSNHTFVPIGYRGVGADGVQGLVANAGQYNIELPDDGRGARRKLLNNPRTWSANLNIRRSFGQAVDLFADISASENLGRSVNPGPSNTVTLAVAAPNNPFNQAITVYFPTTGLERATWSKLQTMSITGGAIVRIGGGWSGTAEYSWNRSRGTSFLPGNPLTSAATTALRAGVVDIVRDVNAYPPDYSPYFVTTPTAVSGPFNSVQQVGSLRFSGPLLPLSGGAATATILGERRVEGAGEFASISSSATTIFPSRSQSVNSVYGEVRLPFIAPANDVAFVDALEIQLAGRFDDYHTNVASPSSYAATAAPAQIDRLTNRTRSFDYTLSGLWDVTGGVRFRASLSTGFLPPSIHQLVPRSFFLAGPINLIDPLRGGELVGAQMPYEDRGNGNPDLEPEKSRSYSFGLVLSPRFLSGLRLSADYTAIRKTGEIATIEAQTLLDNEASYPGRIVRAARLPGDPAGYAGPVTLVDETLINLARSRTAAWDFRADYEFDSDQIGKVQLFALATRNVDRIIQARPDTLPFDAVDYGNGPLRWRATAGVTWSRGPWAASWNSQYYSSYFLRNAEPGSADPSARQGSARIPAQDYHDLLLSYRFPQARGALAGVTATFGVVNIFDSRPPIIVNSAVAYSNYGDARLRRFTFSLTKHLGGGVK